MDIKKVILTSILLTAACSLLLASAHENDSGDEVVMPPGSSQRFGVVGFKPDLYLDFKNGGICAPAGCTSFVVNDLDQLAASGMQLRPLFSRPQKELRADRAKAASKKSGTYPDLTRWYLFEVPDDLPMRDALNYLLSLPTVDVAYAMPAAVTASEGAAKNVPDYFSWQGYLGSAPGGLDVQYAWQQAGGKGEKVTIADIEGDWYYKHRDLKKVKKKRINGYRKQEYEWTEHGTAVMGVLVGDDNNFGVTGIANKSQVYMFSIFRNAGGSIYSNTPDALNKATAKLKAGDVILLEVQYGGLKKNEDYIPVEYYDADFEAIEAAVKKGIVVVEAAGNGNQNLDAAMYNKRFNLNVRGDSGAIMVGAGNPPVDTFLAPASGDRTRCWFSNYGNRVDIQNWGQYVTTTGYGDLLAWKGKKYYYTSRFNGTSSASALTAGVVAVLQGIAKKQNGSPALPSKIRSILKSTGSKQKGKKSEHIGPRPDLEKAIKKL